MGDLTKNFSIAEFIVSDSYPELASKIPILTADKIKFNMLSTTILQPVRDKFSQPIKINSGKRSKVLNFVVRGVITSEHRYRGFAGACDFEFLYLASQDLLWKAFKYIQEKMPFSFGQLILCLNDKGTPRFIHVSLPTSKHQGECLLKRPDGYEKYLG